MSQVRSARTRTAPVHRISADAQTHMLGERRPLCRRAHDLRQALVELSGWTTRRPLLLSLWPRPRKPEMALLPLDRP
jgi:hypothetical protein